MGNKSNVKKTLAFIFASSVLLTAGNQALANHKDGAIRLGHIEIKWNPFAGTPSKK